jgi:hypothetical protein
MPFGTRRFNVLLLVGRDPSTTLCVYDASQTHIFQSAGADGICFKVLSIGLRCISEMWKS